MPSRREAAVMMVAVTCAVPACKSAAPPPQAASATQDVVRGFIGKTLILRHRGDAKTINLKRTELTTVHGLCDAIVEVKGATFDKGQAALTLDMLGRPRLEHRGAHEEQCAGEPFQIALNVSGFGSGAAGFDAGAAAAELESALGRLLMTPEAYLKAFHVAWDGPAAESPTPSSPDPRVTTPPQRLLWADAFYQDPARKIRHEGEVEIEGVVGLDGRLHQPRVVTPLDPAHERCVLRLAPLWRFQPARRGTEPTAAKVRERLVLRIL